MSLNQLTQISNKKEWLDIRANKIIFDDELINGNTGKPIKHNVISGLITWSQAYVGTSSYVADVFDNLVILKIRPVLFTTPGSTTQLIGTGLDSSIIPHDLSAQTEGSYMISEGSDTILGSVSIDAVSGNITVHPLTFNGLDQIKGRLFSINKTFSGIPRTITLTYNIH